MTKNKHFFTHFQHLHDNPVPESQPFQVHIFIIFFYFLNLFYIIGLQMSYESQRQSKIISQISARLYFHLHPLPGPLCMESGREWRELVQSTPTTKNMSESIMKGEGEWEVEGVESPLCAKPHKSEVNQMCHAVRSRRKIWKLFEKSKFKKYKIYRYDFFQRYQQKPQTVNIPDASFSYHVFLIISIKELEK